MQSSYDNNFGNACTVQFNVRCTCFFECTSVKISVYNLNIPLEVLTYRGQYVRANLEVVISTSVFWSGMLLTDLIVKSVVYSDVRSLASALLLFLRTSTVVVSQYQVIRVLQLT